MTEKVKYVKIEFEIHIPEVPNFIILKSDPIEKAAGWTEAPKVSITKFTNEELTAIGAEWTKKLIARAKQIRDLGENDKKNSVR